MADDKIFEARLATALGRYAELAPAMDHEAIARTAIETGRKGWAGWLHALRGAMSGSFRPLPGARVVYLLVILALLLAAFLIAVAGGFFHSDSLRALGGNGAIVYSLGGNNHEAVVSISIGPDGTGMHPIEAGRCPSYSRDGTVLAWISYEPSAYLVVSDADATSPRKVLLVDAPKRSVAFAISPDGTRVAWFKPTQPEPAQRASSDAAPTSSDPSVELWVAPLDGSQGARVVAPADVPGEIYDSPVWSPDGRLIAFGTYVKDRSTGEARRTAIDVVAADGSERRRLTTRPGLLDDGVAWSPDGRYLAYSALADGATERELYVVGVDGTDDRAFTETPESEHDPGWSPDGAFLAFETSMRDVPDRLNTIALDPSARASPPSRGPETDWFVWSPDGRQLLWQELTTIGTETYRTTLHSIDREFRQPPTTLQVVDGLIVCPPTWQRVDK
jgi:dipeptidyl aminopeptidase/acylaminoacyl peptidase